MKKYSVTYKQADSVYFKLNESSSVDDVTEAVKRKLGGANSSYEGFQIVISDSKDNFVSFEVKNRELIASSLFVAPTINGSHNYNDNKDNINVKRLNQAEAEYNDTYNYLISNPQNFNGTNWLAPNGKVSNLSERQYVQVRTESFKNWFGDWENDPNNASKVLDENGEPKVVYTDYYDHKLTKESEASEYRITTTALNALQVNGNRLFALLQEGIVNNKSGSNGQFINNKESNEAIAKEIQKLQNTDPQRRNLYKLDIPDAGYLNWDERLTSEEQSRIQNQDKTIKKAEENIKEVQDAQEKIKQLDAEYQKPQTVQSAATGDSASRIDRLNKLFNTTRKNS